MLVVTQGFPMKSSTSASMLVALGLIGLSGLAGCTMSTSHLMPVGRSTTTGGVVCPSGYEPAGDGSCTLVPNSSIDQNAFR